VIDGATQVKVTFSDGTVRTATVAGKDNSSDVAVLKVDASGLALHPLALGNSSSLRVGDGLLAIGSPFGYQESVSTGIVSGLDRTIQASNAYTVAHAIQTDAALNPSELPTARTPARERRTCGSISPCEWSRWSARSASARSCECARRADANGSAHRRGGAAARRAARMRLRRSPSRRHSR
jgi:Trypsin-like peptidase domain